MDGDGADHPAEKGEPGFFLFIRARLDRGQEQSAQVWKSSLYIVNICRLTRGGMSGE